MRAFVILLLIAALSPVVDLPLVRAAPPPVDFARDIYPLLRKACFECHGPEKQEGDLRLDTRTATDQGGTSGAVIVAGKPEASELVRRIALPKGDDEVMPARGEPLTAAQQAVIRRWIAEGARWPDLAEPIKHWAYVKPVRPQLPAVDKAGWAKHPIDRFVAAVREREGLQPSPEADPVTLVRRLSFDLIGLPPTPAEVDEFVSGSRDAKAYEALVDRLLASPQFGVRWARPWLDNARYADSHGFQRDDFRDSWAFRDWVVQALNADMPFDQFTIEQLAGDLLPGATRDQQIATGFCRCAPTNCEAGSDPEETRVNQVFDRVNTLGMVWLGSTLECCQCHDHKYDPFSQRDYYGLFAFFNNTMIEADRTNPKVPGSIQFRGPQMALDDPEVVREREGLQAELDELKRQIVDRTGDFRKPDPAWEAELLKRADSSPQEHVLEIADFDSLEGATHEILADRSVLISGEVPDRDTYTAVIRTSLTGIRGIKLEALTDPSLPGNGPGRGDPQRPNFVLSRFTAEVAPAAGGSAQRIKFTKAEADFSQNNFDVASCLDDSPKGGWAINPQFGKPHWAMFLADRPFGDAAGCVLTVRLEQNFGAGRVIGRLRLSAVVGEPGSASVPSQLVAAVKTPAKQRTPEQRRTIEEYRVQEDDATRPLVERRNAIERQLAKIKAPTTLIMQELDEPRASTIFMRGDFRTPGEPIDPTVPKVLHPLAATDSSPSSAGGSQKTRRPTRLDLARWVVSRDNPLVARVTVNRWWGEIFGQGLVTTPEDFGIKGEPPTHPELLDWLAVELMDHDWSMKHVIKQIVMSATYRQSSRMTPESLRLDDRNQFYARGPRFRLDAEMIRDNALAVAGLLNPALGGPPIRPYQPDGLWVKVGGTKYDYVVSPGDEKYRRGLYVVWKRAAPYPSFVNFDANARLACRVRRPRSNTPLQALTLMNDPVYVEAAMALAARVIKEQPAADADARINYAFRLAVARQPSTLERQTLRKLFDQQRAAALADPADTKAFLGNFALPTGIDAAEFAAWYAVAAALLNLDETISKG